MDGQDYQDFKIRRVNPQPAVATPSLERKAAAPPPDAKTKKKPKPRSKSENVQAFAGGSAHIAGAFASANHALSFLGSLSQANPKFAIRRMPDNRVWMEGDVKGDEISILSTLIGASVFGRDSEGEWRRMLPWGELDGGAEPSGLDPDKWPLLGRADFLACVQPLPGKYRGNSGLEVILPGPLAKLLVKRLGHVGLEVTMIPAMRQALSGGEESFAVLAQIRSETGAIPPSLVHSLADLPYTLICAADEGKPGLLVDVRCRFPWPPDILDALGNGASPQEYWALGPKDVGHWRVREVGKAIPGAILAEAPVVAQPASFPLPPTREIKPLPVSLVSRPGMRQSLDAVFLDEFELGSIGPYLASRPFGESTFLLPGHGVYLLVAPGGFPAGEFPLGRALTRVRLQGLFLEAGMEFQPPLPDAALVDRFKLEEKSVVAYTSQGAFRFSVADMVPAWSLWIGEPPAQTEGLSTKARQLISALSVPMRKAVAQPVAVMSKVSGSIRKLDRVRLLDEAMKADLAGDIVKAAELLEAAGYSGQAGRLFERAAWALRRESRGKGKGNN